MFDRRSLKLPITLGVIMIVLIVAIIVGWVLLAVFGALSANEYAPFYWTLLTVGSAFLAFVLVGVVMYLTLSIKTINLNRRQSNFVDSVTHELKSPIASIKLYLQTLNRHSVSEAESRTFYQHMLDDVERLDHLINHLLAAGRIENKNLTGEEVTIDLEKLLRDLVAAVCLRYKLDESCVSFDTQPCTVVGKLVDLDMIFRNLLDNAAKYAGTPSRIEIWLRAEPEKNIIISISDNGKGIPADQRKKVFRRFVRLGSELTREKPGTGLGLYIVRTLVQRLGGRVSVHDRDEGEGTTFQIELPHKMKVQQQAELQQTVTARGENQIETSPHSATQHETA
jgi:signal transduction histidine kinase